MAVWFYKLESVLLTDSTALPGSYSLEYLYEYRRAQSIWRLSFLVDTTLKLWLDCLQLVFKLYNVSIVALLLPLSLDPSFGLWFKT